MRLDVVSDKRVVLQELYVSLTQRGGFDCTVQRCGAVAKQVVEPEGDVGLGRRTGEGCVIDFWDGDWKGFSAGPARGDPVFVVERGIAGQVDDGRSWAEGERSVVEGCEVGNGVASPLKVEA